MKFLADQDVYAGTIVFLSSLGHDVVPVARLGLAQAADAELLSVAHQQSRIFVFQKFTRRINCVARSELGFLPDKCSVFLI